MYATLDKDYYYYYYYYISQQAQIWKVGGNQLKHSS